MNKVDTACTSVCLSLFCLPVIGQDHALRFQGAGEVRFPNHVAMQTGTAVTIEGWVKAEPGTSGRLNMMERYADSREHKALEVRSDGSVWYQYAGSPWAHNLRTQPGVFQLDGQWHHVAFERRTDGTYSVYYDGNAVVNAGPGPCWLTCNIIHTTTDSRIYSDGVTSGSYELDDVRVSTVARYNGPFQPQRGWPSDPQTVMLLPFRAGQGATAQDRSPIAQVGVLSGGVSWVVTHPSYASFGSGCAAGPGAPSPVLQTRLGSLPRVGQPFLLEIGSIPSNPLNVGFGLVGFVSYPQGLSLTWAGMPGCQQFILPYSHLTYTLGNRGGYAQWDLPIPNRASLIGSTFHVQGLVLVPGVNLFGALVTNAGTGVIG